MKSKDVHRHEPRRDRAIHEHVHDPYKTRSKLAEPTVCRQCGAVWHDGRWRWGSRPNGAEAGLCQACHRINDKVPAGIVTLQGAYLSAHKVDILGLVRHQEQAEKGDHPLHRIMGTEDKPGEIVINTTDIHLPRRIGEAIRHAHHGDLDIRFAPEEYFIRINWRRD